MGKRKFTGSCVPICSDVGKVLLNSVDSRKISEAIRDGKWNEPIELSESTKESLKKLKNG